MSEHGASTPAIRPRMQDVADAAGVSVKTVSRALMGGVVRESTRQRILLEAEKIGFQRNDIAAGLRRSGQAMRTIGVMLGDLSNPFFPPLLRGIHEVAAAHDFLVLSADAQRDPAIERRSIESFLANRVSGLIVAPTGTDFSYLAAQTRFGSALVFVDSDPLGTGADSVVTTNTASSREGVEHLLSLGHRRIGYLGHPAAGHGVPKRWDGYAEALAAAGIPIDASIVRRGLRTEAESAAATTELLGLDDPPTALFSDNNRLTIGVLQSKAFARRPIAMVGFDSFELAEQFGVTVIDSDPFAVGQAGAELLFERLANPSDEPRRRTIRARLQVHSDPIYGPAR
ncbi:LacI family DNA-binding transcriptional regulator [Leifsonia sp. SIMBA_070]|uniref:LacI family DNA-binding transcriptional regulator n=1 Tax=Leifsonia sp. SIMBA_070 TaxID=3085810 RepID=UPI00397A5909